MVCDPFKNFGVLVSGTVVDDHMHRFLLGHPGINDVEEADELLMAMALHTALPADQLAFLFVLALVDLAPSQALFKNVERGVAAAHTLVIKWVAVGCPAD